MLSHPAGPASLPKPATITVHNTTISGNLNYYCIFPPDDGAEFRNVAANVSIENTIVARNLSGCRYPTPQLTPDVGGEFVSLGYNFIGISNYSTGWIASDLTGNDSLPIDPLLGSLTNNGGSTLTMALLPGSPAIDQGASSGLIADQRGRSRTYDNPAVSNVAGGDGTDIGAFELQSPAPIFMGLEHNGTNVWLSLLSEVGWSYRVERTENLPPTNWTTVMDNLPGTGWILQIIDSGEGIHAGRFYRAATLPSRKPKRRDSQYHQCAGVFSLAQAVSVAKRIVFLVTSVTFSVFQLVEARR